MKLTQDQRDLAMFLSMGVELALVNRFKISWEQAEQYLRDKIEGNKLEEWEKAIDESLEEGEK